MFQSVEGILYGRGDALPANFNMIAIQPGHMYGVVLYQYGTTVGVIKDEAIPDLLQRLSANLADGSWIYADTNADGSIHFFDLCS